MKKTALCFVMLLLVISTILFLNPVTTCAYTFTKASIDTGGYHTIALRHDGTVWTWGLNNYGQLGDGSISNHYYPVQVSSLSDIVAISAGSDHSLALRSDGTVWAWGANDHGKLGDGSNISRYSPVQVTGLTNVIAISADTAHSVALKSDGTVWAWGSNGCGQLGNGSVSESYSPVQVSNLVNVIAISAGKSHTLALKADGTVWAWGLNDSGQLGTGGTYVSYTPVHVTGLANVISISAGGAHSMALKSNGTVWTWGSNVRGQLGDGTTDNQYIPLQVSDLTNVCSISAGTSSSIALRSDGTVWSWGSFEQGESGGSSTSSQFTPVQISGITGVTTISAGSYHAAALKLDGTAWTWGLNAYGQLGNNTITDRISPALVPNVTFLTTSSSIAGGYGYTSQIKQDGTLWSWGFNIHGKLGDGTTINRTLPTQIGNDRNWLIVSAMWEHTIAIKTDGSLWAWGSNTYGQVGDNTTLDRLSPIRIGTDTDWLEVKSGYQHTVALKNNGTLWAWGSNQYGQLGDGTNINRLAPVKIGADADWTSIAVGSYHTVAIKRDGSLWTWGDNRFNQLGDDTTVSKNAPTRIGTANDWATISAASGHTLALKKDCTLWGWGRQNYGELGDGTTLNRAIPTQIGTENSWANIKAIWNHTAAIKTDGSLWACGWNYYGQLGTGTNTDSWTTVRIGMANDWAILAGGDTHTVATKFDNSLWTWGQNSTGQLGNGTLSNQITPTSLSGNNAPLAINDAVSINEDGTVVIDVVVNDSDINGDTLNVTSFTQGAHGTVTLIGNSLHYTPFANYYGSDSFAYQINDGKSGTANAIVNVTILSVNDIPVANADTAYVNEDATILINVLANDYDVDNDTLSVTSFTSGNHGSVTRDGNGLRYIPESNFNGVDIFTYEISDGNGGFASATVNVTVQAVNDIPTAVNDAVTTNEDETVLIDVVANDTDIDSDTLSVTTSFTQGAHGTVAQEPTGLRYTPVANYNGADTFTYCVSDGKGGLTTGTVNLTVQPVNDNPVAVTDTATVNEDANVLINVLGNDSDIDGDTLSINSFTQGAHGTVTKETNSLRYTPAANYNGSDTFTYQVSDGKGATATATVNVTVISINDNPVAVNDSVTTDEDASVLIDVVANDTDIDGDTLSVTTSFTQGAHGTVVKENNSLRYTPAANFNGSDTFTYQISDGKGGTSTATVNLTIRAANDPPVAATDSATLNEDANVLINVLANDSDVEGDTLSINSFTQGAHGTVAQETTGLRYTPIANYNGADTFTYSVSDGKGGLTTGTVNLTVQPVNDNPVAVTDIAIVNEDANVLINVLVNDSDVDVDTLSVNSFTQGAHGTVTKETNSLRYTPVANFNGTDTFTYQISDGKGGTATATVNVTVVSINDNPVAVNDAITTDEDTSVLIDVVANDTDVDDDTLSVTSFTQGAHGTVARENNSLRYTPAANYNGSDTFTYQISDGKGGTATGTVNVTINDVPALNNLIIKTAEGNIVPLNSTFDSTVTAYTTNVGYDVNQITITPNADDPNATVKVNGTVVPNGQESSAIFLNVGDNGPINVEVTSPTSGIIKTYTVLVTRASSPYLSNLVILFGTKAVILTPTFTRGTFAYTASLTNIASGVTVSPTAEAGTNTTIKINGTIVVPSGTTSSSIPLIVGENTITVEVFSGTGTDKKTYTIIIIRRPT